MSLNNLSGFYRDQGRYADAELLYKRSLVINEKALGPDHPDVAISLNNLALTYSAQGQESKVLELYRQAKEIYQDRAIHAGKGSSGRLREQMSVRFIFTTHVSAGAAFAVKGPSKRASLTAETFSVAQLARTTQVGGGVSRMAARFAAGNDNLASTIRDRIRTPMMPLDWDKQKEGIAASCQQQDSWNKSAHP